MSNPTSTTERPLRIGYNGLYVSPECNQSPLELSQKNKSDLCHVMVTVTDRQNRSENGASQDTYTLRFDRQFNGDNAFFELSERTALPKGQRFLNTSEAIEWFKGHTETSSTIFDILKILAATLDSTGVVSSDDERRSRNATIPLVVANYIVTGRVVFPGDEEQDGKQAWKPRAVRELDIVLLDVFANSPSEFSSRFAGFKGDFNLSDTARERARHVDGILELRPDYENFIRTLIPSIVELDRQDPQVNSYLVDLETFVAKTVVTLNAGEFFLYDEGTRRAAEAYEALVQPYMRDRDFCEALQEAKGKIRAAKDNPFLGEYFVQECREGIKLSTYGVEDAAKESLRHALSNLRGLREIEDVLKVEVRRSHMEPDWLAERGQIDAVASVLLNNLTVETEYEVSEGPVLPGEKQERRVKDLKIKVDSEGLLHELNLLIAQERTGNHREPVMAALGVLRKVFGKAVNAKTITVLVEGEYREVSLVYDRKDVQKIIDAVEKDLQASFAKSEILWPALQGSLGLGGVTALALGAGLKEAKPGVREGLIIGGCAATGFSLGSLVNYSPKTRNRHKWGAVGGAAGMVLLGGICSAAVYGAKAAASSSVDDPGKKNGVDEYPKF